jgi:hypothetical protein
MRFLGNRSAGGRTIHLCPLQRTPGASRNWPWDIINILRAILGESSDKSNSAGLTSPGDDSLAPTSNGTHQRRHLGHILVCPAQFLEAKYRVNIDKQKTTQNIEKRKNSQLVVGTTREESSGPVYSKPRWSLAISG